MRIVLVFVMAMMCVLNVSAQVVFEDGDFNSALTKAKSEGKLLFMDCYTSWCGPCKMLADKIFPDKKVGDYMNSKFINLKIDMEKGEGVALKEKYNVAVFPTLLILNSDGTEFSRSVGADSEPDSFIATIKKVSSQSNNISAARDKFKRSLDGANEFIQMLNDNYLLEERDKALVSAYSRRTAAENFKAENFQLYKNLIKTIYHPVALSIMSNGNVAIQFLGKKAYEEFVGSKVDITLMDLAMSNKISGASIYELVTMSKKYKEMKTPLLNYFYKMGNNIDDNDVEEIIAYGEKKFKSLSVKDRNNVAKFTHRTAVRNRQMEKLIPFYEHCIELTKGAEAMQYTNSLKLVEDLMLNRR